VKLIWKAFMVNKSLTRRRAARIARSFVDETPTGQIKPDVF
jgi:hypothetical protein